MDFGLEQQRAAFHIAPATEHDLLEIVEIEEESQLSCWGWDAYYDELTKRTDAIMLVAQLNAGGETQPQIGGFITSRLVADEIHIHNFGVRPTLRRTGLGAALLSATLAQGARQGAVTALLEVRAGNAVAQSFYQKQGFAIVGRRKNYYDHPIEDALTMRK